MSLISILLFHHFCSASSNHIITTVKTSWNIQGKLLARGQTYWPQAPKLDTLAEVPTLGASLVGFQAPLVRHLGYSGRRSFKGQRASPKGRLGGLGGAGGGHLGGWWGALGGRVTRASSSVALTVALGGPYATQRPLFNSFKPIFRQFSGIYHLPVYM